VLKQGERIGDWIVVDVLGEGGMGAVFRCRNAMSERIEAAVKVVKPHSLENEMERFLREVESLDALRHRAVVHVKGWGQDKDRGLLWLAMDLVTGEDLEKRLAKGKMEVEDARRVFSVVADALRHAHGHGIFHRDIKPANIILSADGSPRIVDFGIAVQKGRTRLTAMGTIPGTPAYMAPEIFGGEARPDPIKLDVYALGQVLYEAVTGHHAYPEQSDSAMSTGQSLVALMGRKLKADALDPGPAFPEPLRAVIRAATQPEPADRMADMGAFVEGLIGALPVTRAAQGAGTDTSFVPLESASKAPQTEWVSNKPAQAAPKVAKSDPKAVAPPEAARATSGGAPPPPPPPVDAPRTGTTGGVKVAVAGAAGVGALVAALLAVGFVVVVGIGVGAWYLYGLPGGPGPAEADTAVGGVVEGAPTRDVQVAVTGLGSGIEVDVSVADLSADTSEGMSHTFLSVPTGARTVRVSAGPGCFVGEAGACPGCCSCVEQEIQVDAGTGVQTVVVHVPEPPLPAPRTVRIAAPAVADGWSTTVDLGGAKGPKGKRIDARTKEYADVVPGVYEARVEAGRCPATAQGCFPDGTCPEGCQSWKGTITVPCGEGTFTHMVDLPSPVGKPPPPPAAESSSACRRTCPSGSFDGGWLGDGTRVKLTGIHEEDAYCGYNDIVGLTGTITGEMYATDGCWMGGALIADDGTYYYFYKASLKTVGGTTAAPAPVTTTAFGDGRFASATLKAGTSVQIVDVHPDDAYYGYVGTLTGQRCTVAADLFAADVGWFSGSVYCPSAGDLYFYKVALAP